VGSPVAILLFLRRWSRLRELRSALGWACCSWWWRCKGCPGFNQGIAQAGEKTLMLVKVFVLAFDGNEMFVF
jgi:hypothetical protein